MFPSIRGREAIVPYDAVHMPCEKIAGMPVDGALLWDFLGRVAYGIWPVREGREGRAGRICHGG